MDTGKVGKGMGGWYLGNSPLRGHGESMVLIIASGRAEGFAEEC